MRIPVIARNIKFDTTQPMFIHEKRSNKIHKKKVESHFSHLAIFLFIMCLVLFQFAVLGLASGKSYLIMLENDRSSLRGSFKNKEREP